MAVKETIDGQFDRPLVGVADPGWEKAGIWPLADGSVETRDRQGRTITSNPGRTVAYSRWAWDAGAAPLTNSTTQTGTTFEHVHPDVPFRDLQIVVAHVNGSGVGGGANGGFQGETAPLNPATFQGAVFVPLYILKVAAGGSDSTVTLLNIDGTAPALTPSSLIGSYLITPDSAGVNHNRKQISANTANVVTIAANYGGGTQPAVGDEVYIYSPGVVPTWNGGATSVVVQPLGVAASDTVPGLNTLLTVPNAKRSVGTLVAIYIDAGAGGVYAMQTMLEALDGYYFGSTPDRRFALAGPTFNNSLGDTTNGGGPLIPLILGKASRSYRGSLVALGDSIMEGINAALPFRKSAHQRAAEGLNWAVANFATQGETVQAALLNMSVRMKLIDLIDPADIWTNYGINDLRVGRTADQIIADLIALRAMRPNRTWRLSTLPPFSPANDGQTVATFDAERQKFNARARAGTIPGFTARPLDLAACYEATTGGVPNGKWIVGYTLDGGHPVEVAIRQAVGLLSVGG